MSFSLSTIEQWQKVLNLIEDCQPRIEQPATVVIRSCLCEPNHTQAKESRLVRECDWEIFWWSISCGNKEGVIKLTFWFVSGIIAVVSVYASRIIHSVVSLNKRCWRMSNSNIETCRVPVGFAQKFLYPTPKRENKVVSYAFGGERNVLDEWSSGVMMY